MPLKSAFNTCPYLTLTFESSVGGFIEKIRTVSLKSTSVIVNLNTLFNLTLKN